MGGALFEKLLRCRVAILELSLLLCSLPLLPQSDELCVLHGKILQEVLGDLVYQQC